MDINLIPQLPEVKKSRRSSLSPGRVAATLKKHDQKQSESPEKIYIGKESSVKLPYIKKVMINDLKFSPSNKHSKAKSMLSNYYDISRIQRENNALRDFIHNFHIKQSGDRAISSLDALSNGTTFAIAGKVEKYFSQLEKYIKEL